MPNRTLHLVLTFSLAFNIAFVGIWVYNRTTSAQTRAPQPPPAPWAALNLSPEQRERIEARWDEMHEQAGALHAELQAKQAELFDLLAAPEPAPEAIGQTQQSMGEIEQKMRSLALDNMRAMRDELTPEQRGALFRMMRARGEERSMRFRSDWRGRPREGRRLEPPTRWRRPEASEPPHQPVPEEKEERP